MARFRIVGRVLEEKKLLGYVILNENIKKAIVVTNEQMSGLFQQTDFVNAEYIDGQVRCTENATDRLPKFTKDLKPVETKPSLFILSKLVKEKNGEVVGFRVINSNDCITNKAIREYNLTYDEFVKMILSGTNVVNAKLVNGKTIKAIKGNFEETVLEESKEVKKKVSPSDMRKKQHLKKIVYCAMTKINRGRDNHFYRISYNSTGESFYVLNNLNYLMKEVYQEKRDKFDDSDYECMTKLYMALKLLLKKYNVVETLGDIRDKKDRELAENYMFAFCTYLFDAFDKDISILQRYSRHRAWCVEHNVGSKKLKGTFDLITQKEYNQAIKNKKLYWQYPTSFNLKEDLEALGYTLYAEKDKMELNQATYYKVFSRRKLKYLDFSNFEEFRKESYCVGDYLIPYNIISSIVWLGKNKSKYKAEEIKEFLAMIELKLAILALYNPEKAKLVKDICTNDGKDTKNWYFLPNFDYESPASFNKRDDDAVFYRSAFHVLETDDKLTKKGTKYMNKTPFKMMRYSDSIETKEMKYLFKSINQIVSDNVKNRMDLINKLYLIPNM